MGLIGSQLSFARVLLDGIHSTDAKIDTGGGENRTGKIFGTPGDDSPPMAEDYAVAVDDPRTGGVAVVGYIDPNNAGTAEAGERRIYSRDESGAVIAEVYLQKDGSVSVLGAGASLELGADGAVAMANGPGSIAIDAAGVVTINGVTIDTAGNITTGATVAAADVAATGSVEAPSVVGAGLELVGHAHAYAGLTPPAVGTTGPNQ